MTSDEANEALRKRAPFVLALDIGTSSLRAALFDAAGREVEATQARLEWSFATTREGGAEIDAEWLLAQVERVIDESLSLIDAGDLPIKATAVSCFWHTLVGVDAAGRALTPLFGWAETRAVAEIAELRARFDEGAAHARTGCRFHPGYWPAKLLWLKGEQPEIWRTVARWLSFGEFLMLRFCGVAAASVSQASATGLFDQQYCIWDDELLAGLDIGSDQLPSLAPDAHTDFHLTDSYAARWPQLRARPWFAAIGDGVANNVGAHCVKRNALALMIGTSGAMRVLYEGEPPARLPASLWCYRLDRRRVIVGGALSDGGWLYSWMRDALNFSALQFDDDAVERELTLLPPDAHGLTILPFWAGERSTNWNAHARGAICGLTMHTRPIEILRAAMEAVAYRFAHIARALDEFVPRAEIRASGGALSSSPVWTQMLADVLARPVKLSLAREASSRGAALLALESLGVINELPDTNGETSCTTFNPDMEAHARYRAGLERQELVYQSLLQE